MNTPIAAASEHKLVRVLVVDDSSMTRWLLQKILSSEPGIEVVGCAEDAKEARRMIMALKPDVITLDVEMPGMNGIDFLRNLMRMHPMPVVMVSTLTRRGGEVTLEALSIGAIDYIHKPKGALSPGCLASYTRELVEKVVVASAAQVNAHLKPSRIPSTAPYYPSPALPSSAANASTRHIVAIGASTGGTEAVRGVLSGLPADGPGVLVVQHITEEFNAPFVAKLDSLLQQHVCNAVNGQLIKRGCVYVAPANKHLSIKAVNGTYRCILTDGEAVNYHRPSVDVLFESVATAAGADSTAAILTGMGKDGAMGLGAIRRSGGHTIAQDENTSVVWGMPGASVKLGAAVEVVPLDTVAESIIRRF
jgi:two-component system chemotaxis response regulator CheB